MRSTARLSWRHARIAAIVFLCFAALTLLVTHSWANAAEISLGPFAGAVARDWQRCCAENSWSLAPYGFGTLLAGLGVQFLVRPTSPPRSSWIDRIRLIVWGFACFGWFFFAILSYGHALE
jgi:hypothetical protein